MKRSYLVYVVGLVFVVACSAAGAAEFTVPKDFPTIHQALQASKAGDVVKVLPGRYVETVVLKDGVTLSGAGAGQVTVVCPDTAHPALLASHCAYGTVSGITFEGLAPTQKSDNKPANHFFLMSPCYLQDSSILITKCAVKSGETAGIAIFGNSATTIRNCTSQNNRGSGIYVLGPGAAPILVKNNCSQNGVSGISLNNGVSGKIQDNTCAHNRYCGIAVNGPNSDPTLTHNSCTRNKDNGIAFGNAAHGTATGNQSTHNVYNGLSVLGKNCRVRASKNILTDNQGAGVWITWASSIEGQNNVLFPNGQISQQDLIWTFDIDDGSGFATLESVAKRLRTQKSCFRNGSRQLPWFYTWLTQGCVTMGQPEQTEFLKKIDAWKAAFPNSITWRLVLAHAYSQFAWRERGADYASQVSQKGWQGFFHYIKKSWDTLQEAKHRPLKITDPDFYVLQLQIAMEADKDRKLSPLAQTFINAIHAATGIRITHNNSGFLQDLFEQGRKLDPLYFPLYNARVWTLLPRWGGSPDEILQFAESAANEAPKGDGDLIYAEIACTTFSYEGDEHFEQNYPFSWPRLDSGFAAFQKEPAVANYYLNYQCRLACAYEKRDAAKALFKQIDNQWNSGVWSKNQFQFWEQWAIGQGPLPEITPLQQAISTGDEHRVDSLISEGADVNKLSQSGNSPLLEAMLQLHPKIMTDLINAGAKLDYVSRSGDTLLTEAVGQTSIKYLKLLLDRGAKPNVKNADGWPPLLLALAWDKPDFADALIEHGADPNLAAINGRTAIYLAAEKGFTKTAQLLIERGAQPNVLDPDYLFPLAVAARARKLELATLLLDHGANPNFASRDGETALFEAVDYGGDLEMTKLLISKGADINHAEVDGWSVYHQAVKSDSKAVLEYLLSLNPKAIAIVTKSGRTLLQQAVKEGHLDLVQYLIDRGADINARETSSKLTALGYAKKGHFQNIVKLLLAHGATE